MKLKSKKKKILFIVLFVVAVLIIAGDWALTVTVYNENFNQRFESYEPLMLYVDDFEGLQCSIRGRNWRDICIIREKTNVVSS